MGGLCSSQAQQDEVSSPCQEQGRQGHQRGGVVVCGWDVVAAAGTWWSGCDGLNMVDCIGQ